MIKNYVCLFLGLMLYSGVKSQQFAFQWAKQLGDTGYEYSRNLMADQAGNIIALGGYSGMIDLDPGAGTYTQLAAPNNYNSFVVKLSSQGNFLWGKTIEVNAFKMVLDAAGNTFITGIFNTTVDFDPGTGTFTMSPNGFFEDIFVMKLDPQGNFLWASNLSTPSMDEALDIAVDATGNSLITGQINGNPFVSKLTPSGTFLWTSTVTMSLAAGLGESIGVDGAGNVYSTGRFQGIGDFDPGSGTYTMAPPAPLPAPTDAYVWKLDPQGNFLWARQFSGPAGDEGIALTVDNAGDVYAGGIFTNISDFDPGPGTYTLSASGVDTYIVKLNASGNFLWATQIGGPGGSVISPEFIVDQNNDLFIAGYAYGGSIDFDPGLSTVTVAPVNIDAFVTKFTSLGNFAWLDYIGGTAQEFGTSVAIDPAGYVYAMGSFTGTADFDPTAQSFTLGSTTNSDDVFIQKFGFCSGTPTITVTPSSSVACIGSSVTLTAAGATNYTWTSSAFLNPVYSSTTTITVTGPISFTVFGFNIAACSSASTTGIISTELCDVGINGPGPTSKPLEVFPNPAHDHISISAGISGVCHFELYDGNGRLLEQGELQAADKIFTISFPSEGYFPGLYFIRVVSDDVQVIGKLIIE